MLSFLIAVLMMSGGNNPPNKVVYGNKNELGFSLKFFSILVCFLVAFLLNVQSIRHYSHASILINVPNYKEIMASSFDDHNNDYCVTPGYVGRMVSRGSYFWSLGVMAFYFSFPFL